MSVNVPLLQTIEADKPEVQAPSGRIANPSKNATNRTPVILTPTNHAASSNNLSHTNTAPAELESGLSGILKQSSHPLALFLLCFFRVTAITTYILCGFFTDNYVLSSVIVVVLLAMDFWNCKNVAGRTLVGLRYWNQVNEDGENYWVFEARGPSRPANSVDSKIFWVALYVFPVLWTILVFVSSIKFLPIVVLAIVFNYSNAIGFTYADRDAKRRWSDSITSNLFNLGGMGGQVLGGMMKNSVSRFFG